MNHSTPETRQSFESIARLYSNAREFHAALQRVISPKMSPEEIIVFETEAKKSRDRYLRVQIEKAKIVDAELAPRLRALQQAKTPAGSPCR